MWTKWWMAQSGRGRITEGIGGQDNGGGYGVDRAVEEGCTGKIAWKCRAIWQRTQGAGQIDIGQHDRGQSNMIEGTGVQSSMSEGIVAGQSAQR